RGDEERQTQDVDLASEADCPCVDQPEEDRADGPREAGDAGVCALELTLFRRTHAPRHEALQRRRGKPDRREYECSEQEDQAVRREAPGDERRGPGEQRGQEGGPLAETRDESSHEASLDRDVQRPNQRERQTDVKWRPTVAIVGVQDEEGREGLERQELDERDGAEAEEVPVGAEQGERPDRIRAPPGERLSVLQRERLRQDEQPVAGAGDRTCRGDPEREADAELADDPADRGTEDEA